MVNFWEVEREKATAKTKMRIKKCGKLGLGESAMREKQILKRQERQKERNKQ